VAHREIACVERGLRYPGMPEGLFYGPRQYQPSASTKLSALNNYLKVAPNVLPEEKLTHASVLWHGDLHTQNFFVDPGIPTRIMGIIDWQSASASPLSCKSRAVAFWISMAQTPRNWEKLAFPTTLTHCLQTNNAKRRPCTRLRRSTISTWPGFFSKTLKRSWQCGRETAYVTRLPLCQARF
jgi:hypothetical protein